jgi:MbtH-like protein
MHESEATTRYRVVVNDEEQYSIWPLRGRVDVDPLRRSLDEIVRRARGPAHHSCHRGRTPPPGHHADFAIWQREWFRGTALQAQLAY